MITNSEIINIVITIAPPLVLIHRSGKKLQAYLKENYPREYRINDFEPEGYIVNSVTPNLFLFSSDAKNISKKDNHFKKLRRNYGFSMLFLFLWILGLFLIDIGLSL
jgi:hypothetical protein